MYSYHGKHPARWSVFFALATALIATVLALDAPSAQATDSTPPPWIFPVVGEDGVDFAYGDTFGACRSGCTRRHHGVDIGTYGIKGVPVVAAADGVVRYVNWSWDSTNLNPDRCCTIALQHADGWETWYIHLNNDTAGTDDGNGWGIAPGILPGVDVRAGQLIGWVGDSGNAEGASAHLHWEVHAPGGVVENPTPHADSATRISSPVPLEWQGTFWDDDGSVHRGSIEWLVARGITKGCNPPDNDRYCPTASVTRGQMAAFLDRALGLPPTGTDFFTDDDDTTFEGNINRVAAAGITLGCGNGAYCPNDTVTRGQMAAFLARGLNLATQLDAPFTDDDGSPFEDDIEKIAAAGVTLGCQPGLYCPNGLVTRGQMAAFLHRALS